MIATYPCLCSSVVRYETSSRCSSNLSTSWAWPTACTRPSWPAPPPTASSSLADQDPVSPRQALADDEVMPLGWCHVFNWWMVSTRQTMFKEDNVQGRRFVISGKTRASKLVITQLMRESRLSPLSGLGSRVTLVSCFMLFLFGGKVSSKRVLMENCASLCMLAHTFVRLLSVHPFVPLCEFLSSSLWSTTRSA